jgi:hypothetical protein
VEPPAAAVPVQETGAEVGVSDPEVGFEARAVHPDISATASMSADRVRAVTSESLNAVRRLTLALDAFFLNIFYALLCRWIDDSGHYAGNDWIRTR